MIVKGTFKALTNAVALGSFGLQRTLGRCTIRFYGTCRHAGIKQSPVEQHPGSPVSALGIETWNESWALTTAVQLNHRRGALGRQIARCREKADARQQCRSAAIGSPLQRDACSLQGLQLGVVLKAAHYRLL